MNNKNGKNISFDKFGRNFQIKIIKLLIQDKKFFLSIFDILKPKYFTNDSFEWLYEKMLKYFEEYNNYITFEVLGQEIKKEKNDELKRLLITDLTTIYKIKIEEDVYIKETVKDFCVRQDLKEALYESISYLDEKMDVACEKISHVIMKSTTRGNENDLGLFYDSDIRKRQIPEGDKIPTPWKSLNMVLKGGPVRGEFGTILAESGAGKSHFLNNLTSHAIQLGFNVLYITLELDKRKVAYRHDANISGIDIDDIHDNYKRVEKAIKEKVKGKLIIKQFPSSLMTTNILRGYLNQLKLNGIEIDLIAIDYCDIMRVENTKGNTYNDMKLIYEDCRSICVEYNMVGWTVSQVNREGMDSKIVNTKNIADAISKIFTADIVGTIGSTASDKQNNTATFFLAKSRDGCDAIKFPMTMDKAKSRLTILDPKIKLNNSYRDNDNSRKEVNNKMNDALTDFLEKKK